MSKSTTCKKIAVLIAVVMVMTQMSCRKEADFIDNPVATASRNYNQGNNNTDIVQSWYALALQLVKETPGHSPAVTARSLGYMGITLYQTVLPGESGAQHSLVGQLNGLTALPAKLRGEQYAESITVNAAMAKIIKSLFGNAAASNLSRIDSLEAAVKQAYSGNLSPAVVTVSANYGRSVADAVFAWSMTDGGHQAYLNNFPASYVAPVGPGLWVSTSPAFPLPMLPYWGSNRTFVAANGAGPIDPPAPPVYSTSTSSAFYTEAMVVYNTVNNLSPAQKEIATYWADGGSSITPPGHNIAIVLQLIRNKNVNLLQAATLLAKTGIGLNDAAIVCWRSKFKINLLRPVSYIRDNISPLWSTFIPTPPFPSYTSGHASFSGVTASLLTDKFGDHFSFTDSTKMAYGFAPRQFNSFDEAAEEAAISRLYGGIHYRFDNANGVTCGRLIGANVTALSW